MRLTAKHLALMMPRCPVAQLDQYAACLTSAMIEAGITTVTRAAAFLGQLAHESGELQYMEELADGSAYEGRTDLGNTEPGDGARFKGRGPIQLTGRKNYERYGAVLGIDLIAEPHRTEDPDVSFRVAALYWTDHQCNAKADALDFEAITRAINGGLNGHAMRLKYYHRALEVLGSGVTIIEPVV